jgi:type IV pilus assembly protein PilB
MVRKKIGDILIEKGLVSAGQLESALEEQRKSGGKLGEILVEKSLITEEQLVEAVSERLNISKISISSLVIDRKVIAVVPVEIARRYGLIPVFRLGNVLTIAMADPLNIIAVDEIKYLTKCEVRRVIALQSEINNAIDQYYSVANSMHEVIGTIPKAEIDQADISLSPLPSDSESESPVIKLVDLIISRAIKEKSSDIHIEPYEDDLRIRYRVNGVMKEEAEPPKSLQHELVSRIKVKANMDVSEKRLPQDGRFTFKVDGFDIDLRVSTLPTIHGEKIVIRILDKRVLKIGLDELGFTAELLDMWRELIRKKEGLILITGPTSSGKSTTLYSSLQEINSPEKNIITVEDPVEYSLPMINQVQTNEKAGLTFASLLRSILRQNPDIVMIGEIRDTETARMAVRSALTGHLVFSTLHTNDAPNSLTRLLDMGLEKFQVAAALKGVLAQRLLRTNCPSCIEEYQPDDVQLRMINPNDLPKNMVFKRGTGCSNCRMNGYAGQTGLYELININSAMTESILSDSNETQLKSCAERYGYRPIFQAGLEKVKSGIVSLEELLRVISIVEQSYTSDFGKGPAELNVKQVSI